MTKKQRVAAAKKAARSRKRNAALGNTTNTKKKNSKKKNSKKHLPSGTSGVYICHLLKKNGDYCNKTEFEINRKTHENHHKGANKASSKNITSENQYVKKLEKGNPSALVFQTGKEAGVPDIVMIKNGEVSFYEVKPTSGSGSQLKVDQGEWIKKNCLGNKIDAYLVTYKGKKKFKFKKMKLNKNNIDRYTQTK